jgi:hypothetical protein
MSREDLRPLEREALRIVRDGNGKHGWYQVARILPVYDYPGEEHNASKILQRLEQLGLLKSSITTEKGAARYQITEAGVLVLDEPETRPTEARLRNDSDEAI